MIERTKTCNKCGESFPLETTFFYRCNKTYDGLHPNCKACVANSRARKTKRDLALKQPYPPYARWAVYEVM